MFRYQTETTLRAYQLGLISIQQKLAIDPVFGMHVTFAQTSSSEGVAPYKTAADYDNGLKRIGGVDASPYLRPTHSFPDSFTPQQHAHFDAAYRTAVAQQILPALGRLAFFLKKHYLSASRTGAPGLATLPGGAKLYEYALEQHTELLARYEDIRRQIDALIPKYFSPLPKGRFELRPCPNEQESSGGGAYYVIGTPDGQRPGVF